MNFWIMYDRVNSMMRKIFVMISWLTRTRHLSENNTDHNIHKYEIWTILFGSFLSLKRFKYFIEEPLESNSNWLIFLAGIRVVGSHIISVGADQKVVLWQWELTHEKIRVDLKTFHHSFVPDIHGLDVSPSKWVQKLNLLVFFVSFIIHLV